MPDVIGDGCTFCDNIIWAFAATPQFLHVKFDDLERCFADPFNPPDGHYIVEQDSARPCWWIYEDDEFYMALTYSGGDSALVCTRSFDRRHRYFYDNPELICQLNFNNDINACFMPTWLAKNGTALVWM